jgi:hypothetical protein
MDKMDKNDLLTSSVSIDQLWSIRPQLVGNKNQNLKHFYWSNFCGAARGGRLKRAKYYLGPQMSLPCLFTDIYTFELPPFNEHQRHAASPQRSQRQ